MTKRPIIALVVLLGLAGSTVAASTLTSARATPKLTLPGAPNCPIFPANNVWNEPVAALPTATNSATLINTIGANTGLHPDFGTYPGYGIPYQVVPTTQPRVPVTFDYASESDPGPYPIPAQPTIEAGSDHHMIIVDRDACYLYELYDARLQSDGWHAGSGAIWNLRSNHLRPDGWTSADAAGLPILPGLARYDEVSAGLIDHALRFTAPQTRSMHIYPARHDAGAGNDPALPPMGLRVRLKASVDISGFSPQPRAILQALKTYGMMLADNGSAWYISGVSNAGWSDDDLHHLNQITGADLEVVDTSSLRNGPAPALTLSPSSGPAGTHVAASGLGYFANEPVVLKLYCASSSCTSTTVLGSTTTNGGGAFSLSVTIPATTAVGGHEVGAIGQSSGTFAGKTFTVTPGARVKPRR